MESDIYKVCRHGDIDLAQVLIKISPDDTDINRLELNGSTALHIACSKGYTHIIRVLLNNHRVDRHRLNNCFPSNIDTGCSPTFSPTQT